MKKDTHHVHNQPPHVTHSIPTVISQVQQLLAIFTTTATVMASTDNNGDDGSDFLEEEDEGELNLVLEDNDEDDG